MADRLATVAPPGEGTDAVGWHALEVDAAVAQLVSDRDLGLSAEEVGRRRALHGPNELGQDEPPSRLSILLRQFASPLITILLVAAVVTLAIGEYLDTGVIVAVLVLNAVVGFFQEHKADRSVRALLELAAPRSRVVRGGAEQDVDSRELVPGDVVLLESGTRVPADLRLTAARTLQIDESLFTGESLPASKRITPTAPATVPADRTCMAHMGTVVTSGRGRGLVVATGSGTELGRIAHQIRGAEQPESPLTRRMHRFANLVAAVVLASAALTFVVGLAVGEPAAQIFLTAVALAVAVVPEGLPVALTIALALGVRRMAQRNAIIRSLPAVETLGSTNTIGSDKTGTLTQNRMTVQHIWVPDVLHPHPPEQPPSEQVRLALLAGVLTNEAELLGWDGDEPLTRGDPTEAALLVAAARSGIEPVTARQASPVVAEVPFEPELRYSSCIRWHDGGLGMFVKGAPERVLELSATMRGPDGDVPLDAERVLEAAGALAAQGLRVLAMGFRPVRGPVDRHDPPHPDGLVFLGLVGMLDPPRPGVRDAIEGCKRAGLRILMITGDHAATARAVGYDLGLVDDPDAEVVTGVQLDAMTAEELRARVLTVQLFARVSPAHKLRIVEALRDHGEVVAVTGDGVNDGPALKAAHIGVAMGRSGTDVAREAGDMVLADDNFVSIYHAVEQGRVVFDNIRKVTYFLLSTGVASIAAILYALAVGLPLPFLPAQLLWLNVVTNGLQDVALAFEPGEKGVLDRAPRRHDEPVVSRLLWERTLFTGTTMAVGALLLFWLTLQSGAPVERARTAALTTLVIAMAFHVYNARSERQSLFRMSPLGNRFLLVATLGAVAIHVAAMHWGPTQLVLRIEPLDQRTWLRMLPVAATVVVVSELHKKLRAERPASTRDRRPGA
ncbi:MAG: HAD-IC family P-type ATPase [Egibacteraceae bacterium]